MPASDSLPNLTGHLVDDGRLRLLEVLGAGSYGVVYKALDTTSPPEHPIHYAVKCLGSGSRFDEREIALHTACSSHPSIITLHRQFYTQGYLCIVLELAACDLWAAMDEGAFHKNNALVKEVFIQLLDAVRFCHQRAIHHRDLKPENILCRPDGSNIRIADFGMALDDDLPCSSAGGTTAYMTPESLTLGRRGTYEPAQSDVWACCIILLNMMSCAFPWRKAVNADPGWNAFLTDEHYLRREFPISDALNELLERCFRPVPHTRPSLLQLRLEINKMKDLFKFTPELPTMSLLTVPTGLGPSAPSTPGASFSFNLSDYPSPATSNASSVFIELNPVRLSEMADRKDSPTIIDEPAASENQCPSAVDSRVPQDSTSITAQLSPAMQNLLARMRSESPLSPSDRSHSRTHSHVVPPTSKKLSRNPLKRFCRWIKKTRGSH
ncbi:kinase-like domain-containing protein [Mycena galericulata]|nr:kinase-like domain-containing protein [Mycena galericulata]